MALNFGNTLFNRSDVRETNIGETSNKERAINLNLGATLEATDNGYLGFKCLNNVDSYGICDMIMPPDAITGPIKIKIYWIGGTANTNSIYLQGSITSGRVGTTDMRIDENSVGLSANGGSIYSVNAKEFTSTATDFQAEDIMKIGFARIGTQATDNYEDTIWIIGVEVKYTSSI